MSRNFKETSFSFHRVFQFCGASVWNFITDLLPFLLVVLFVFDEVVIFFFLRKYGDVLVDFRIFGQDLDVASNFILLKLSDEFLVFHLALVWITANPPKNCYNHLWLFSYENFPPHVLYERIREKSDTHTMTIFFKSFQKDNSVFCLIELEIFFIRTWE